MSKKDYQMIARAIYESRVKTDPGWTRDGVTLARNSGACAALNDVVASLSDALATDNPRFDRARFIEACETGKCKGMSGM